MIQRHISGLQKLLDKQSYPVTYRDADYNIIYANKAASEMFDIHPESMPIKCYRSIHGLENLPVKCYCGYGSPDIKITEVIEPSINSILKRIYLPVISNESAPAGFIDIFCKIGTLDRNPSGFTDDHYIVLKETTGTDWQKAPGLSNLTDKERETLLWIKKGKSPAAISKLMQISGNTVNFHMKNIFNKLGADNRAHAVALAYEADMAKKDSTIREMGHRVKNNFSILSSIISLHSSKIEDETALKALRNIDNLIRGFVSFQTLLLNSDGNNLIPVRLFADQIIRNTKNTLHGIHNNIEISSEVEDIMLDANTAIPCMQIINELICNAVEHAFKDDERGKIVLVINSKKENTNKQRISLSVKDNGKGLPDDFHIDKCEHLGMEILQALVSQIDGSLDIKTDEDTQFTVSFTQQLT